MYCLSLLLLSQKLFDDVAIHTVKGNDYRIHFWNMSKAEAANRMKRADLSEKKQI